MRAAKGQAGDYARALLKEHGWPPFVLVGRCRPRHRGLRRLLRTGEELRPVPRPRAIWTDPNAFNPAARSAEVTRDIAGRLARIARNLEGRHDPRVVAEFFMGCLFNMFAEDVGLLPDNGLLDGSSMSRAAMIRSASVS